MHTTFTVDCNPFKMRHLKASLIAGIISSMPVFALLASGAFDRLDGALLDLLGPGVSKPLLIDTIVGFVFVLCAFGVSWTTIDIVRFPLKIVVAAAAFLQVLALSWVLGLYQIFFPPFAPALAILLSFGIGILYARGEAGGRKRVLRHLFEGRISRGTFRALLDSSAPLGLEGGARDGSVFVCRIFNRDELLDGLPVADYAALTNLFLKVSTGILKESGAYLDECGAGGVRAFFGALLPDSAHAVNACKAALEIARQIDVLNFECKTKWHMDMDVRIGVESGELACAAYGAGGMGAFGASGGPVDFAERLCGMNLAYGSRILIGPGTLTPAAVAVAVRPVDLIREKSDARTRLEIYELIGMRNTLSEVDLKLRDDFWRGVIFFRERLPDEALDSFREAIDPDRKDAPLEFYIRRVEEMRAENHNAGTGRGTA